MIITNKFGCGEMTTMDELLHLASRTGRMVAYCTSAACLSVTSDFKSWVTCNHNIDKVIYATRNVNKNNTVIIVLGCQISDLAILNTIKLIEELHEENPTARVYLGGCLAYRFDVELPEYVKRIITDGCEYTPLDTRWTNTIKWERPFWIDEKNWNEKDLPFAPGHLFRDMYPLRIGAGSENDSGICNLSVTRGKRYESDAYLQVREFIENEDVVLVSDEPTEKQIKDWCHISKRYNKEISIKNLSPSVICECENELKALASAGLLKIIQCSLLSLNEKLLKELGREPETTFKAYKITQELRNLGVYIAANFIVDFEVEVKGTKYKNENEDFFNEHFDYWSWIPYFNGEYNQEKANDRFKYYLGN